MSSTALTAPVQGAGNSGPVAPVQLRPVISLADVKAQRDEMVKFVQDGLKEGVDFGVIPGTGNRPALYKAGAENCGSWFNAEPVFEVVEREVDHDRENRWSKSYKGGGGKSGVSIGLYRYVVRCRLVQRHTGLEIGQGLGSCSTMESKYIDRPRDSENTVLKMAQKRAHVAAVLSGLGLSDRFTQDIEEQRGTTDIEREEIPREPMTLERAKALKLPFKKSTYYDKPMGTVPPRFLAEIAKWAEGKLADDPDNVLLNDVHDAAVALLEDLAKDTDPTQPTAAAPSATEPAKEKAPVTLGGPIAGLDDGPEPSTTETGAGFRASLEVQALAEELDLLLTNEHVSEDNRGFITEQKAKGKLATREQLEGAVKALRSEIAMATGEPAPTTSRSRAKAGASR